MLQNCSDVRKFITSLLEHLYYKSIEFGFLITGMLGYFETVLLGDLGYLITGMLGHFETVLLGDLGYLITGLHGHSAWTFNYNSIQKFVFN